ncbi:conjugal transfer protein [Xylanimonas allomyrinae]|uniref:Conjugal transfer protein n=2 Tax=Xylanimonas allomyrinae TaxID=2509459 RepID=A0A4V0YEN6_9MICO|nr:conjugal transfer protein [Xylanimonas allomyrinae]
MRVMSAGDGYAYLLRTVVVGDGTADRLSALTRYYTDKGTPPGTWMGSGVVEFGNGELRAGMTMTPEQLQMLLGKGLDPLTGEVLGRPYQRYSTVAERVAAQVAKVDRSLPAAEYEEKVATITAAEMKRGPQIAVAGFDLTFAVPKSVSALWAVADAGLQEQIVAAHHAAVAEVLDFLEREVAAARVGAHGIAQVGVRGVAATAFDHYDSRANDPHLHTHVVVSNKVRTVVDGLWRTLDSRALHGAVVALSEHYHAVLADRLSGAFGVRWEQRARGTDRNPSWDVVGVPGDLMAEFSSRSRAIDVATDEMVAGYVAANGRRPSRTAIVAMRARATLATRPEKVVHSLSDLSASWRRRAGAVLRTDAGQWARGVLMRGASGSFGSAGPTGDDVAAVARRVVEVVGEKRSTWRHWNLWAEAARQTMGWRFATAQAREKAVGRVVAEATRLSVRLTPDELAPTPAALQRDDGSSVLRPRHAACFTSEHHLLAEARLLDGAAAVDAPMVDAAALDRAAGVEHEGRRLSIEQAAAVTMVATSGRAIDVLVGPAGAGKTTAMRVLQLAWTIRHGADAVVGLAPSAVAAGVLAADLGIGCETTAKWLYEHGHGRAAFRRGQLVIVDEATLASTRDLDAIAGAARAAGAKVLLVGDWAQLQSVDAGGAFSLLVEDRGDDVAELTDVHRFVHGWERVASLALRRGGVEAIDLYANHGRLHDGTTEQMVDTAYGAWRADQAAGKASILVTDSADSVRLLNQRARAERILDGETRAWREATLGDLRVSAGDLVITRLNDRRLRTGNGDWVRNGDRWQVLRVRRDGSLEVRRAGRRGGVVTLPAWYVTEHVDLGYAVTAHRAQGVTVDTCHVVVSGSTTRENLYVAMTRGRYSNTAYVALDKPDESHAPPHPGDATAASVLYGVLQHTGRELSAHETMRAEQERWGGIAQLADEYEVIAVDAVRTRWADLTRSALVAEGRLTPSEADAVVRGGSFGAVIGELRHAEACGSSVDAVLTRAASGQTLLDADDVGAVLATRIALAARKGRHAGDACLIAGLVPDLRADVAPDVRAALDARRDLITARATALAQGAVQGRAPWVQRVGELPQGVIDRERWLHRLAAIAAYRDRYGITGRDPLGPEGVDAAQRRDADRARAALRDARALSASTVTAPGRERAGLTR